jgi:hypothetical protein
VSMGAPLSPSPTTATVPSCRNWPFCADWDTIANDAVVILGAEAGHDLYDKRLTTRSGNAQHGLPRPLSCAERGVASAAPRKRANRRRSRRDVHVDDRVQPPSARNSFTSDANRL